ncbi:MAG TPA: carbohydrate kinase family protein [Candidatus Paceibacterota bacterium]
MRDFVAIGDTTVDEFIRLKDASVNCDINTEACTISMKWGDKLPYEFAVRVSGVGNAANAAVSAARLGLVTGFVSNVGGDAYGEEILATFKREHVDTRYVRVNEGVPTNHDYVLWYEAERTILIRHEEYPYSISEGFASPKWVYLSSAGRSEQFHMELASWVAAHPETKLAFQPSTFEMSMGTEKLSRLYKHTELVACNKEEAERILELGQTDIKELLEKMRALGPRLVLITDGPGGAYSYDGERMLFVPMYPDPKPPYERTGAGDACTSTVVAALALGVPLAEALLWGPVNAMSVVQEIGAQKGLLTREALECYLNEAPAAYTLREL